MGTIEDLLDHVSAIGEFLSQVVYTIIHCIIYPFQLCFYWMGEIFCILTDSVIGICTGEWNLFVLLFDFFVNIFVSFQLGIVGGLIVTGLTIVFVIRVYYLLPMVK